MLQHRMETPSATHKGMILPYTEPRGNLQHAEISGVFTVGFSRVWVAPCRTLGCSCILSQRSPTLRSRTEVL